PGRSLIESPSTPCNPASVPAGAFQTPRAASVRANVPATAPQGANACRLLSCSGSGISSRGKYTAAWDRVAVMPSDDTLGTGDAVHVAGASTSNIARRDLQ